MSGDLPARTSSKCSVCRGFIHTRVYRLAPPPSPSPRPCHLRRQLVQPDRPFQFHGPGSMTLNNIYRHGKSKYCPLMCASHEGAA